MVGENGGWCRHQGIEEFTSPILIFTSFDLTFAYKDAVDTNKFYDKLMGTKAKKLNKGMIIKLERI